MTILQQALTSLSSPDDAPHEWKRRIHTRRSAYDQLLAEACELAGVPSVLYRHGPDASSGTHDQDGGPEGRLCRNADERFSAEMELAARGWHW